MKAAQFDSGLAFSVYINIYSHVYKHIYIYYIHIYIHISDDPAQHIGHQAASRQYGLLPKREKQ